MGINIYKIKRWVAMLSGKSIYHVDQDVGKAIIPGKLGGYYNDLTQKVLMGDNNLDQDGIPFLVHSDGSHIQMPTMIFQYGLGAFDLWILSEKKEDLYLKKAKLCADWAIEHQLENGAWNNFFYIYPEAPFSAMPQGEGISLLLRLFVETENRDYLEAASKAVSFLLTDINDGGVSQNNDEKLVLMEYTNMSPVLNGWIFALWGLYDYCLVTNELRYVESLKKSVNSLKELLPKYDCGYWSMYNLSGMITSPFYHKLHIAQLKTMYLLTNDELFDEYANKFTKYSKNIIYKYIAFIKKVIQKLMEKK